MTRKGLSRTRFPIPEILMHYRKNPGKLTVRDWAQIRLQPGLLAFLCTTPPGSDRPPARGVHPMSGVPLGVAVEAAIVAASGKENGIDVLRACECSWEEPIPQDGAVTARADITALGRRHVEAAIEVRAESNGHLLMRGKVTLVKVNSFGNAADLTGLYAPASELTTPPATPQSAASCAAAPSAAETS